MGTAGGTWGPPCGAPPAGGGDTRMPEPQTDGG
jgi:hypothetical protein